MQTGKAIKSKMNNAEEHISDSEDRIMEITQSGQQKGNQMKKDEINIRDLWDKKTKRGLKIYLKKLCLKTFQI